MVELTILKSSKEELELLCDNLTIVELLRAYLNEDDGVQLAVWRREHPTKQPLLFVRTKGKTPKKAIADAIKVIEKQLDNFVADVKKLK